jgi:hypothetical protein
MTLLIATPGPQQIEADVPAMRDVLPALPVLAALLARARRLPRAVDWRAGVLTALGGPADRGMFPAVTVAARAAPSLPAGTALCFAAPLHLVAGMSRVHLPPGGWLRLDPTDAACLVQDFNREFGDPQLQLHAVTGGWLMVAPFAAAARDAAPEDLVGEPLARVPARDAAERVLRRLGAEVEIWLAGHPLNRAREARQLPAVNTLWFWGGAQVTQIAALPRAPRAVFVAGDADAWLAGLAAHCAVPLDSAAAWHSLAPARDALLVLAPPPAGASTQHWLNLETQWFAPAARALRSGAIDALRLQIGASAWQLPDPSPLRWLRRSRPWYQQVLT